MFKSVYVDYLPIPMQARYSFNNICVEPLIPSFTDFFVVDRFWVFQVINDDETWAIILKQNTTYLLTCTSRPNQCVVGDPGLFTEDFFKLMFANISLSEDTEELLYHLVGYQFAAEVFSL